MERHFDSELRDLKQKLLQMADTAQAMIGLAVRGFVERDGSYEKRVDEMEGAVNRLENEIEEDVIKCLALRQPAAGDLRFLTATLKITGDLERVADQACNMSGTVSFLLKEPPLKTTVEISKMAELAQNMLRRSIEAFVKHDAALARTVCEEDDAVDAFKDRYFRDLLELMKKDPGGIERAMDLILLARNLERVADHATNIAEDVIFIEQGRNIKHHSEDQPSA
jgi:phosphate transport system protein